ncbi:hypothetical protein LSAT2_020388 [Lamellibrachia satsuma]|nr:hypothetical protein LSAT2_020388 [Lamellibrachia satsuma]
MSVSVSCLALLGRKRKRLVPTNNYYRSHWDESYVIVMQRNIVEIPLSFPGRRFGVYKAMWMSLKSNMAAAPNRSIRPIHTASYVPFYKRVRTWAAAANYARTAMIGRTISLG